MSRVLSPPDAQQAYPIHGASRAEIEQLPAAAILGDAQPGMTRRRYVHASPSCRDRVLWACNSASSQQVDLATKAARGALEGALQVRHDVIEMLETAATLIEKRGPALAAQITADVGKPIRYAHREVQRAAGLFRAVARRATRQDLQERESEALVRRRPQGVVAIVTPWNNPLAIPAGQLAPALAYGNSVVWKPALAGLRVALDLWRLLLDAGLPRQAIQVIGGDDGTGLALVEHAAIDAVSFTGSTANGRKVLAACADRHRPCRAELGGNNGAVIGPDHDDPDEIARTLAEAAFACAGQRCTATRRAIVLEDVYPQCVEALKRAAAQVVWGDPEDERTQTGPLLSAAHAERTADYVQRAAADGCIALQPHLRQPVGPLPRHPAGAYYPPTVILCDRPDAQIVQDETFAPLLVVQRASDWDHALGLLNGVRQGLVASLFSRDPAARERFLRDAQAGVLRIDRPAAEVGIDVPLGGWKASGWGPAQHGKANLEFYTRLQTIY